MLSKTGKSKCSTILLVSFCIMILLNTTVYILDKDAKILITHNIISFRQMKRNMDENLEMTYFIMRNGHNCMSQIECTPSTILYIWYLD